jgi:hypothetical protein
MGNLKRAATQGLFGINNLSIHTELNLPYVIITPSSIVYILCFISINSSSSSSRTSHELLTSGVQATLPRDVVVRSGSGMIQTWGNSLH